MSEHITSPTTTSTNPTTPPSTASDADRAGILAALDWLIEVSAADDVVVLHYSGHGDQLTDNDGDELDGYDEVLVPYGAPAARAAFIVEADNVAPAGKANGNFSSLPPGTGFSLSATPSAAAGLAGNQSIFGNPANATGPDQYTFRYTPGTDADNTTYCASAGVLPAAAASKRPATSAVPAPPGVTRPIGAGGPIGSPVPRGIGPADPRVAVPE